MVDENFRRILATYCEEQELQEDERPLIFDNQAYDNSIIGLTDDNRLVYDYEKMVKEYMSDNNSSEEEAIEWIEYNTMRSLGYGREKTPIIVRFTKKFIEDFYG